MPSPSLGTQPADVPYAITVVNSECLVVVQQRLRSIYQSSKVNKFIQADPCDIYKGIY